MKHGITVMAKMGKEKLRGTAYEFGIENCTDVVSVIKKTLFEDMPTISQLIAANERVFWGGLFVTFGSTFFGGFLYTAVISKLLPPSDNAIVFAIQNDSCTVVNQYRRLQRKHPLTAALFAANTLLYIRPTFLHLILPPIGDVWFNPHLILKKLNLDIDGHLWTVVSSLQSRSRWSPMVSSLHKSFWVDHDLELGLMSPKKIVAQSQY
ncbi:hypothetical protein Ccrd_023301 [Cynara cardunculus var. scolymus]|uniref:Uncharacterized protein n=1 Tax=Cynara cardunculus var. scolymus TaxID=59895 RepID=A0A103XX22_CYNCS|nr:hypothetical protein Ccrd_023301 [Cynara cardunculus var. scolymus]